MRLFLLPTSLLLAIATAQEYGFSYPYSLNTSLTDYTSLNAHSALNFSAGDSLFGAWRTPPGLNAFFLLRCVHTPTSDPIRPSNSTFNSTVGRVAPDGTWEQMPFFIENFENGIGSHSIFLYHDFFEGNATTGNLCWYELYPGHEGPNILPNGNFGSGREVTVSGDRTWYFASLPFVVKKARPNGLTVQWKEDGTERGKPAVSFFRNSSEEEVALIRAEFSIKGPTATKPSSGSHFRVGSTILLGALCCLTFACLEVL